MVLKEEETKYLQNEKFKEIETLKIKNNKLIDKVKYHLHKNKKEGCLDLSS